MRRTSALLTTPLSVALVLATLELSAATAFAQEPASAHDSQLAEAKALNEQAEIKFQTAEYEQALELWKQAFAIVPDSDDTRTIRNALVYNIAEAHIRAYEVSRNPTHLRKAKILLENYQRNHQQLYGDDPEAIQERSEAGARIAQLDKMLAESEAKGEVATSLDSGPDPSPGPGPIVGPQPAPGPPAPTKPMNAQQRWEAEVKADPTLGPKWEKGKSQVVGGAVLTGIGSLFLLSAAGMFVWGGSLRAESQSCVDDEFFDTCGTFDGTGAFVTGGVFGVLGLGMAAPGIALIAIGVKRRQDVKAAKPMPVAMAPYLDLERGTGGVTARFQF